MPPSRRRHTARRRPDSHGTAIACAVAAVALAAAMGVTMRRRADTTHTGPARPAAVVAEPVTPMRSAPAQPVVRTRHPLDRLAQALREAERRTPGIKRIERGPAFEEARIALLAQVADARDAIGRWLDAHPSDDRANRLWDRALRLYVALRKL